MSQGDNVYNVYNIYNNIDFKPYWKILTTFMIYFVTRYVSNDLKFVYGNILNSFPVKTICIFSISYQATGGSIHPSLIATLLFVLLQMYIQFHPSCKEYRETSASLKSE